MLKILAYHQIVPGSPEEVHAVNADAFARQLDVIAEWADRVITIDDLLQSRKAGTPMPRRCLAITFDDGYRDNLTEALPLLEAWGFPATIFLVTDAIGGVRDWGAKTGQGARMLDWDEIRDMRSHGMTFGAHGCSHRDLRGLTHDEAGREIVGSRLTIEAELGVAPTTFCFPYSGHSERIRERVADAGFEAACTYRPHYIGGAGDRRYELQRIGVLATDTTADFEAKLRGGWGRQLRWRRHQLRSALQSMRRPQRV